MRNLLKEAEKDKKSLTKAEIYGIMRTYVEEEISLSLRKMRSEDSFDKASWSEHQAYQLGIQKAFEKLLDFIPNLDQRNT